MNKLVGISFIFAFVFALNVAVATPAQAQSSSVSSLAETLKTLLAKVADLQKQIAEARGEIHDAKDDVKAALKENLKEGMTDDDIKEIQEILATDSSIYPEGLTTGYFGSLTKNALKRFQAKHSITQSGQIDKPTKDLLEEYYKERRSNTSSGWRLPNVFERVQDNVCGRSRGVMSWSIFCKDFEHEDDDDDRPGCLNVLRCGNDDDDDDEDEDEDEDDDTTEFEVEIEVNDGDSTVEWTYGNKDYTLVVESVRENRVLTAIARKMRMSLFRVDKDFVAEVKEKLAEAIEDEDTGTEADAFDAIEDAEDAIEEVQTDIDNAEDGVDTDDAQDALDDAQELLDDAQEAFDDENFDDAEDLAKDAQEKAEEADDLLQEAIEDAE